MSDIYKLEICCEYGEGEFEDHCFLGLYSSEKKAEKMIDFFKQREEYKKYGRDCFIISKCLFIDEKQWAEGFISRSRVWEEEE